ncbi:MAG: prolyl oligopeptidase family serine peptidase [Pseudomonadota bacterium]|nr:prolyl oligopeptidase family serine peptidase [Pseudomonadota bacterium]
MRFVPNCFLAVALMLAAADAVAQGPRYPESPRKPVIDEYHGIQVTDEYRWLEDGRDPAVRAWSEAQLGVTREALDALPLRKALRERLRNLFASAPVSYYAFHDRGSFFAMKRQPPRNQPFLVAMKSPGDVASERILLDPNEVDAKGTTAIDFFVPSLDGKYVAVAISERGSEDGSAHVIEAATGKRLPDVVPRVQYPTGGGSIAWDAKGTGFYYTRYPQGTERAPEDANFYQQVYFHKLGTPPASDTYVIGKDFPRIAEISLKSSRDGRYLVATVANGDGGEYAHYLRDPRGHWTRVADHADKVKRAEIGRGGHLYLLSLKDAPRGKVLRLPLARPALVDARVIVAEGESTIVSIAPARDRLYVTYMVGGPSELRMFDLAGKPAGSVPTEPVSSVSVGAVLDRGDVLVASQSFVTAPAWYRYSPRDNRLVKTALAGEPTVSFADAEVVREMVVSKDGTRVPINILMKKGTKRDGTNPVLLSGYGTYGLSMRPWFSLANRVWLDHGGVYVLANLRGGGEFGEAWHLAANVARKQTTFDDMIAVAQHLVDRGYTSRDKLAAMGGSAGGLLMGAIVTQRPDLFRAVVANVGIYDMLRVELTPNGAFNVPEFGSVKDRAQFDALYAYSPYHRVKDGTAYPALLLTTGENDGRVAPYNSRKMAARMQAASTSGRPVLLRVSFDTGHGQGTGLEQRVEENADTYAFLMSQLGMN